MPPFSRNLVILQRLLDNFIYSQTLFISATLIHALLILLQSFISSLYDLLNISLSVFLRNLSSLPKIDLVCLKLFSSSIFSIKASFSRGFPGDSVVKNLPAIQETHWVRKIPWRRTWQLTPVFLPGEPHGQRSLVATIHGIAKSWTRLKWLSTHSWGFRAPGMNIWVTSTGEDQVKAAWHLLSEMWASGMWSSLYWTPRFW